MLFFGRHRPSLPPSPQAQIMSCYDIYGMLKPTQTGLNLQTADEFR
jgi:hypothetical protein